MAKNFTHYIYVFLFLFVSTSFSQNLSLNIESKNKQENQTLTKLDFVKSHKDSISLFDEINKIHKHLKNQGYFTSTIDSIIKKKTTYTTYFSLNDKVNHAMINVRNIESSFSLPINQLEDRLKNITTDFDNQGKVFSKIQLINLNIKNDTLFADLIINESNKRKLNRIIIKGYERFPKSYVKHYFKLKNSQTLTKKKIAKISDDSKNLSFIKEIKSPEILFTKDSTQLYLYLEKFSNNSVDAIVNFASQENGDLLFNGNIDLRLENVLNTGEQFKLFWNSIGNERQEFKLSTRIAYVFKSPISPEIEFSLYRQDSTFTSTKLNTSLRYDINTKLKLGLFYSNENSENLLNLNNTESFKSNFFGFDFSFEILKNDLFRNKKIFFNITPTYGTRKAEKVNSNQFKILSKSSYLWNLNNRSSIYINNETGILNSDQYLDNELFRIGGINSIRGFNEQSIFTRNYSFFNIEYRFLTSSSSYLYTISDLGFIKTNSFENVAGLGLGYLFINKNSKINLGLAIGKSSGIPFNINNTKLAIGWINYF